MKGINFDIGKSFFREWIFIISIRFRPFHPFSSQRWTFITMIDFHHIDEFLSYIWILIRLINFHHIDDGLFHCTNCIIQMNFHHTNQFSSNWYISIKNLPYWHQPIFLTSSYPFQWAFSFNLNSNFSWAWPSSAPACLLINSRNFSFLVWMKF